MNLKEALLKLGKDESIYQGANACFQLGNHELSHYYEGMSHVWDELMETEVVSNNTMSIRVYICEGNCTDIGYYLTVDGYEPSSEEMYWALDFVPWSQWLGCQILKESVEIFGLARCIGEILWEMTFYGWTSERIQEKKEEFMGKMSDLYIIIKQSILDGLDDQQILERARDCISSRMPVLTKEYILQEIQFQRRNLEREENI